MQEICPTPFQDRHLSSNLNVPACNRLPVPISSQFVSKWNCANPTFSHADRSLILARLKFSLLRPRRLSKDTKFLNFPSRGFSAVVARNPRGQDSPNGKLFRSLRTLSRVPLESPQPPHHSPLRVMLHLGSRSRLGPRVTFSKQPSLSVAKKEKNEATARANKSCERKRNKSWEKQVFEEDCSTLPFSLLTNTSNSGPSAFCPI